MKHVTKMVSSYCSSPSQVKRKVKNGAGATLVRERGVLDDVEPWGLSPEACSLAIGLAVIKNDRSVFGKGVG